MKAVQLTRWWTASVRFTYRWKPICLNLLNESKTAFMVIRSQHMQSKLKGGVKSISCGLYRTLGLFWTVNSMWLHMSTRSVVPAISTWEIKCQQDQERPCTRSYNNSSAGIHSDTLNSLLYGDKLKKLQLVQNQAACIIVHLKPCDHVNWGMILMNCLSLVLRKHWKPISSSYMYITWYKV